MSKYSSQFKLEVVQYQIDQHCGCGATAKHFGIPDESVVKRWFRRYQKSGGAGLVRNQQSYDGNFKINVVEYMHAKHLSLSETAIHFNLGGADRVGKWERIYYEEGPLALFEERRGRSRNMSPKKIGLSKEKEEDLIAENQRLRMENAYLKKLRALVQERTNRESKTK